MTDNEILARWQGKCYHVSDWGQTICKYCGRTNDPRYFDFDSINSDYLNDDAAAMSLLDTLVEKQYPWKLWWHDGYHLEVTHGWDDQIGYTLRTHIIKPTRREAVVAAVLELIGKEGV